MITEIIKAKGHKNITAKHKTTLEITKDTEMTPRGDCIVAVSANRGFLEFSEEFKSVLRQESAKVEIKLSCEGMEEVITAYGHPDLTLTHPTDMVVRKSDFICPRTLAIKADKAAIGLDRRLVEELEKGKCVETELRIYTQRHA